MGYCIELGYGSGEDYEVALVTSFTGGSHSQDDPGIERETYELLASLSDQLESTAASEDTASDENKRSDDTDADGVRFRAEIDITTNYSQRIREVADMHLSDLRGKRATEGAALLLTLIAGLGDDTDPNYWKPADGNIKQVASTILDWTFQHPDAVFRP